MNRDGARLLSIVAVACAVIARINNSETLAKASTFERKNAPGELDVGMNNGSFALRALSHTHVDWKSFQETVDCWARRGAWVPRKTPGFRMPSHLAYDWSPHESCPRPYRRLSQSLLCESLLNHPLVFIGDSLTGQQFMYMTGVPALFAPGAFGLVAVSTHCSVSTSVTEDLCSGFACRVPPYLDGFVYLRVTKGLSPAPLSKKSRTFCCQ
jgi:hypothetical protein